MAEKFDNPNYNPEAGMKFLTTHFEMFNPDVAKAMIADAKRKGVKIPPVVEAKARKAGILNAARNARDGFGAEIKVGDIAKFITGTWRGLEGTVVKIEGDKATVRTKKHGNVVEDLKLVRVYNSVRNAKFKVGDTVEAIRDRVHKLGVKGTVLKVDADTIVVKWADDGFTARYGIEGNFKNLTKEPKATPEDKMKTELSRSGAGSNPRTAHTWLTRHRRGLVSKYGSEVYEKVKREATRGLLNAQIRSTNAIVAKAMNMDGNSVRNANVKWVIYYWDGGKEKIEAPTREAAKREADKRSRKSGRGYKTVIVDDGVDYDTYSFFNSIHDTPSVNCVGTTNAVVAKALNAVKNAWADAPDAATAKRDIEQTVRKAADIAKRRSGAKVTYKMTPNDSCWCGYIELTFNTEEEAKKYNPYYLFDELGGNKSILPKWSWAISSFSYQKNGKVVKIFVGRLAT